MFPDGGCDVTSYVELLLPGLPCHQEVLNSELKSTLPGVDLLK